jgi:hypothetical protein
MFIPFNSDSGIPLGDFPFEYFFDNTNPRFRRTFSLRCKGTRCKPNDCFAFEARVKIRKILLKTRVKEIFKKNIYKESKSSLFIPSFRLSPNKVSQFP